MLGNYRVATQLVGSRVALSSVELVTVRLLKFICDIPERNTLRVGRRGSAVGVATGHALRG
jgi:hypothetical protein